MCEGTQLGRRRSLTWLATFDFGECLHILSSFSTPSTFDAQNDTVAPDAPSDTTEVGTPIQPQATTEDSTQQENTQQETTQQQAAETEQQTTAE